MDVFRSYIKGRYFTELIITVIYIRENSQSVNKILHYMIKMSSFNV